MVSDRAAVNRRDLVPTASPRTLRENSRIVPRIARQMPNIGKPPEAWHSGQRPMFPAPPMPMASGRPRITMRTTSAMTPTVRRIRTSTRPCYRAPTRFGQSDSGFTFQPSVRSVWVRGVGDERHDFDAIWRTVGPTLWRALFAYTGGRREVAEDAVVEAFARAIERDGAIRDPSAYLYRVAFRIAAAELRRDRVPGGPVEESTQDPVDLGDLLRALRRLSPSQRAVYLHYEADLPVREVARLMATSTAAVKVHLMRGRRRLAALLDEEREAE